MIFKFAKSFGNDELDWLRRARGLNISSDVITNLSKLDGFADKMDEILELIKKSSRSADEVAECIIKHGDKAIDAIRKYGDDAVDAIVTHGDDATRVIGKYGDDAVDRLKKGKTPEEIEKELGGSSTEYGGLIKDGLGKISGIKYTVTQTDIDTIRNYLIEQGFIDDYANQAMLDRLETALSNEQKITGADAVFYTHELKEAELVSSGVEQTVAHEMALDYYKVSPYSVYHPDVIKMKPEWWNNAWFEFWGIER